MAKRSKTMLPERSNVTMAEVKETMKDAEELDIAALAREHSEEMLGALVDMAQRKGRGRNRAPHAVAAASAKTVLEIGHGRSATKERENSDTGLTIVINSLTTGVQVEKVISGDELAVDINDPIEITGKPVNLADELVEFRSPLSKPSD